MERALGSGANTGVLVSGSEPVEYKCGLIQEASGSQEAHIQYTHRQLTCLGIL